MKTVYFRLTTIIVTLTLGLAGTNRVCAQADQKSAENQKDVITAVIQLAHCPHEFLVELEDINMHSKMMGRFAGAAGAGIDGAMDIYKGVHEGAACSSKMRKSRKRQAP